ncbi:hypothetical protein [Haloferax larsenii]|uniref:Uncharacterized protein n=1 Tax=Haloferax larsenii TaxID=302484 RepID=A0A1H7SDU1_HALLR|nr:hypothetical protein [Haloferax larsenii]ELZ81516.1 hypothetical protein C455_04966 [Haloferax larsenii JCM 13917]UVE49935.1 hypothetical protein KU306_13580 [Haloferax larsenii]SEL70782.1 hypothetical protein SAMN04488691_10741 [Haloferax larsenii]
MPKSDRTGLILVFMTLLVAAVFGLAVGIPDHFRADRFLVSLTPDFAVLFGSDVLAGTVLVLLFAGLVGGAKILLGP